VKRSIGMRSKRSSKCEGRGDGGGDGVCVCIPVRGGFVVGLVAASDRHEHDLKQESETDHTDR
jgi:hypothetical protein